MKAKKELNQLNYQVKTKKKWILDKPNPKNVPVKASKQPSQTLL